MIKILIPNIYEVVAKDEETAIQMDLDECKKIKFLGHNDSIDIWTEAEKISKNEKIDVDYLENE